MVAMPRGGAIIFSDLIGKLDMLRVACAKCGRDGSYRLNGLIEKRGRDAKLIDWLAGQAFVDLNQCSSVIVAAEFDESWIAMGQHAMDRGFCLVARVQTARRALPRAATSHRERLSTWPMGRCSTLLASHSLFGC